MSEIRDKVVLLTGAASGIGRATAVALAGEGARSVIVADIDGDGLSSVASEIEEKGSEPVTFLLDVVDEGAVRDMVVEVLDRFGGIDILINSAGIGIVAPIEELDMGDWRRFVGVILQGVLNTVVAVYPDMIAKGSGHIVNVASTGGLLDPGLYMAPYITGKFGVVGLSEALMLEACVHGIDVTCFCPGVVRTRIYESDMIKGFDSDVRRLHGFVLKYLAEEPEETALQIIDAIKRNRFLVVSTPQARIAYFFRRHLPITWYIIMRRWVRLYARAFDKYRLRG